MWLCLVDDVDVVEQGIHSFDARDLDASFLRKLDGRTEVCFNFHGSPADKVLIHDAVGLRWDDHLLHRLLAEVVAESAALHSRKAYEFVHDTSDERTGANLLQELGV